MVMAEGYVVELSGDFGERYHEFVEFVHAEFFDVGDGSMGEKDVIVGVFVDVNLLELVVKGFFGGTLGYGMYCYGFVIDGVKVFFILVFIDEGKVGEVVEY